MAADRYRPRSGILWGRLVAWVVVVVLCLVFWAMVASLLGRAFGATRDALAATGRTGVSWSHASTQTDTALTDRLRISNGSASAGSARWTCAVAFHHRDDSVTGRSWRLTLAPGASWSRTFGPFGESSTVVQVEASCGPTL